MLVDLCESRLSVHIECSQLRNMDRFSLSDPFAILFHNKTGAADNSPARHNSSRDTADESGPPSHSIRSLHEIVPSAPAVLAAGSAHGAYTPRDSRWEKVGRTETVTDTLNVAFATSFEIPYFFERNQKLAVDVFDSDARSERDEDLHRHDYLGSIEVAVPSLVRAPSQKLTLPLKTSSNPNQRNGFCTLIVEEVTMGKQRVVYDMSIQNLRKTIPFSRAKGPFVTISRRHRAEGGTADKWIPIIRTPAPGKPTTHPRKCYDLGKLNHNYQKLCHCDENLPLRFDVSYEKRGKHKVIATSTVSLKQAREAEGVVDLVSAKAVTCATAGSPNGQLLLQNGVILEDNTFLDYIVGGCEISLVFGIDFTSSNGDPLQQGTLHYWDTMQPNEYELAIRAVGDILAYYDTDERFPAYGFGAKLPPDFQEPRHIFSLTDSADPTCHKIDEVLNMYRQTLYNIRLSGPTVFAEIIRAAAAHAQAELSRHDQSYTILLIVTDGIINDLDNTLDEIAKAAFLPLSIVIIGVGNADFTDMERLDGDDRNLDRDIVQFVNFRQFKDMREVLQAQVLEEIPRQFLQYMEMHKILPRQPPID